MVQRYELELFHQKGGSVNPCDDGGYVEYEDYAELERKFNELRTWRTQILNDAFDSLTRAEKAEAELQKYKDQFPDYVECANCGSVTHVEGIEDTMGNSGCHKEDAQECKHKWVMHDADDFQTCSKCGEMA